MDLTRVIANAATGIVTLAGLYLVTLAMVSWLVPATARRFLAAFAGSVFKHYLELGVRLLAGASFIIAAPHMAQSRAFAFLGWILVGSTIVLGVMPWRLHQRFAELVVPQAIRYLGVIGLASMVSGMAIIWSVIRGS